MKKISILLTIVLMSCSAAKVLQRSGDNSSILILQLNYNSYGMRGYGGSLTIRNVNTNETYKSQKRIGFKSYVLLPNVPPGKYAVEVMEMIAGSNSLVIRTDVFNEILIKEPSIYFLGNYSAKKIPPVFDYRILISEMPQPSQDEIYKEIYEESNSWINMKINYNIKVFKDENSTIDIR